MPLDVDATSGSGDEEKKLPPGIVLGPDGKLFFRHDLPEGPDGELRIGLALGVDWYVA